MADAFTFVLSRMTQKSFALSSKTLKQLNELNHLRVNLRLEADNSLSYVAYKAWLLRQKKDNLSKKEQFLYSQLEASLLKDLMTNVVVNTSSEQRKQRPSWLKRYMFGLACIGGIIFAICDGIDSSLSFLTLFTNATLVLLIPTAIISIVSMVVFVGFDIHEASKNLGLSFFDTPGYVDKLQKQQKHIKALLSEFDRLLIKAKDNKALSELKQLLDIIGLAKDNLIAAKEGLVQAETSRGLQIAKEISNHLCALFYFGTGFFIGQGCALQFLGGVSMTAAMATPLGAALFIGLSTLCAIVFTAFYYIIQGPGVKNLIGKMFGFDGEKIEALCDEDDEHDLENNFNNKQALVTDKEESLSKVLQLRVKNFDLQQQRFVDNKRQEPRHQFGIFAKPKTQQRLDSENHRGRAFSFS